MECKVESSQEIKGYRIFIGRVVDQEDYGKTTFGLAQGWVFRVAAGMIAEARDQMTEVRGQKTEV